MAFQAVPNTAEVTVLYVQNLEIVGNVFHAKKATGYALADILALAANADGLVGTWLLPAMTQDCTYLRTEVRGLAVPNDLFALDATSTGPGAIAEAGLPNSVTLSLKKGSGLTGRSARGRWYFVGMNVGALTTNENIFDAAQVLSKVSAVNNVRNGITATVWDAVIVSRVTNGVERSEGITFPWITVTAVDDKVDSQRRRLS